MEIILSFIRKPIVKQIFIFCILGFVLYQLRSLATLLLLTFVFIYIFSSAQKLLYRAISHLFPISRIVITVLLYVLFIGLLVLFVRIYIPVIIDQLTAMIKSVTDYLTVLQKQKNQTGIFNSVLAYISNNVDLSGYMTSSSTKILSFLTNIGTTSFYILIALILSLFFMIDRRQIARFTTRFKQSKLSWMYSDTVFFIKKFTNSFGKVIQNQILISFINAILSMIFLLILGFQYIVGLGAMIFILGLVPVAGVFISLIPLSIIAFYTGGLRYVIYILVMIAVLHTLEGYILNPKLMSRASRMPVFFTLLVLIVSEHFLGVWGLIIGLPLTMFVLDILDVIPEPDEAEDHSIKEKPLVKTRE